MVVETSVLFGVIGVLVTIIGGVIARDRQITGMIQNNKDDIHANDAAQDGRTKEATDQLHERVNRLRDEMGKDYVRRSDLDGHLSRIEKNLADMKADMKDERRETNLRLDAVLAAVRKA